MWVVYQRMVGMGRNPYYRIAENSRTVALYFARSSGRYISCDLKFKKAPLIKTLPLNSCLLFRKRSPWMLNSWRSIFTAEAFSFPNPPKAL